MLSNLCSDPCKLYDAILWLGILFVTFAPGLALWFWGDGQGKR